MIDRDKMMQKVAAAKTYTQTIANPKKQEEIELAAFMAIFHPDFDAEKLKDQTND
jgi:hypothetical protein